MGGFQFPISILIVLIMFHVFMDETIFFSFFLGILTFIASFSFVEGPSGFEGLSPSRLEREFYLFNLSLLIQTCQMFGLG